MIIELNNVIKNPDALFFDRLTDADYEYLLSKAINSIIAAIKRGKLTDYEGMEDKMERYRREQSAVLTFLYDMHHTKETLMKKPCMVVYKEFEQYCHDVGMKPVKKTNFDTEICKELKMSKKNTTNMPAGDNNQTWRICWYEAYSQNSIGIDEL